jgi:hypothetical protein
MTKTNTAAETRRAKICCWMGMANSRVIQVKGNQVQGEAGSNSG